jgi:hypothetical protein
MNGANIAHAQAGSPQALLDFSTPFDLTKLAILEQIIAAMYSPNRKDVSISC